MKINILIPCGVLNGSIIEIDRFKRFKLQLENISKIPDKTQNINWFFCEFGNENKLEKTIKKIVPFANYIFYKSNEKFNQIDCWNYSINIMGDFDFVIFSHSDILFSNNLYNILNKRLIDKNKNYYSFRLNAFVNDLNILNNELKDYNINCSDLGLEYLCDLKNIEYKEKFQIKGYCDIVVDSSFKQTIGSNILFKENNQIPESFICLSKDNIFKLNLNSNASYHNDVVIRDLSILKDIKFEWVHDDICLIHMLGLDLYKSPENDFDSTLKIIQQYKELSHFGVFRFHPNYIPYLKNLDLNKVYKYRKKDTFRDKTFEQELIKLL